jgi:3-oxoacyl-[acyl-carrier-protein] synthase II
MQLAYVAAEEAIEMSKITFDPYRTGVVMGTALSGLTLTGQTQEEYVLEGKSISPRFLTRVLGNLAAAQLAIHHDIKGPCYTMTTACSSGGDAVSTAAMLLETGAADAMVVMAGESAICPLFICSLAKAGALSKDGYSCPFDKKHNGFVTGEGGGSLILETEENAKKRGAVILGELLGYANCTDGYHPVAPQPEGLGAAACMGAALAKAGLKPSEIGYINAHGTSTVRGDIAETKAIKSVFGDLAVPVSSTKGATGHMMGAGGITEIIACIKAIETGLLPPTIHCDEQDEECDANIITDVTPCEIDIAMSNAFGFGGQNSSVIVGKYRE